ncbi:uncharacterized protein si:ch211-110p13.9 [Dunckerocampus dactyliophorus]|uniref:uncharacterized protein si:ch211-110p13.9 n=1 Tax=Dunckerocampus dactyliophorus TaxID=161453 RepID=UPI002404E44D|nr:uncharacterized protein si:ch211-110p13.9 [Dunckerocampus dactyliophorus]
MSHLVHLSLPQWDGGLRKIRYIYLVNNSSFTLKEWPQKAAVVVPLFLAADLFSNTNIRPENHPRCHAKYARKGLATKIHFSAAFRFRGLKVPTSNNSLWFYSIHGLFRVAFEMFTKQEQLGVLENFQDVWKSQINASPLKMSYSLSEQLDVRCDADARMDGLELEATRANISSEHDHCYFSQQRRPLVSTLRSKLQSLDDKLSSEAESFTEQQLETLLHLLHHMERCFDGTLQEQDVAESVLALLESKEWSCVYSSPLLDTVARWLGRQFGSANGSVSRGVEGFKVRHIDRISELPPAEELAAELFPQAMRTLLLHWMRLSEEADAAKRRSEYPILLLILEFANHNLITGVAHVLYSSLICK